MHDTTDADDADVLVVRRQRLPSALSAGASVNAPPRAPPLCLPDCMWVLGFHLGPELTEYYMTTWQAFLVAGLCC